MAHPNGRAYCGTIILFISFGARNIFGLLLEPVTNSTGLNISDFSLAVGSSGRHLGLTTPITASLAERYGTARMIALVRDTLCHWTYPNVAGGHPNPYAPHCGSDVRTWPQRDWVSYYLGLDH